MQAPWLPLRSLWVPMSPAYLIQWSEFSWCPRPLRGALGNFGVFFSFNLEGYFRICHWFPPQPRLCFDHFVPVRLFCCPCQLTFPEAWPWPWPFLCNLSLAGVWSSGYIVPLPGTIPLMFSQSHHLCLCSLLKRTSSIQLHKWTCYTLLGPTLLSVILKASPVSPTHSQKRV